MCGIIIYKKLFIKIEMLSPNSSSSCQKKHKKHKSEKRERDDKPGGLKLILKVGSQNTPEHITDFTQNLSGNLVDNDELHLDPNDPYYSMSRSHHKKSKKKKKKKDKNKDREKRHKHHHKEKKRKREENDEDMLGSYKYNEYCLITILMETLILFRWQCRL